MTIEKEYVDAINKAKEEGYEPLMRVQVYYPRYTFDYTIYVRGGRPYLVGKQFGNITILKIVNSSGMMLEITSSGKQTIPVNEYVGVDSDSTRTMKEIHYHIGEEQIEVDSYYEKEDGEKFYFKKPF